MTYFPPKSSILTSILMTRAGYAQLQGQIFHPPRVFGPEWSVQEGAELDDERRWRELGVKISTGFEIMYREGGKKGRTGEVSWQQSSQETLLIGKDRPTQQRVLRRRILHIERLSLSSNRPAISAMRWKAARNGREERQRRQRDGRLSALPSE